MGADGIDKRIDVVVNEYGETIGVLTFKDVLDTIFTYEPTRSGRLLDRKAVKEVRSHTWHVTGDGCDMYI